MRVSGEKKSRDFDAINRLYNIVDYMDYAGIAYKPDPTSHTGDLRLVDHDSLVVTPSKNAYFWFSRDKGGHLASFISEVENVSKSEAREKMKVFAEHNRKNKAHSFDKTGTIDFEVKPFQVSDYKYQKPKAARDYLINQRKISPRLVDSLIKHDFIRERAFTKEALFMWRDKDNHIVGCDRQGTEINYKEFGKRGTLKKIASGSEHDYGFNFKVGDGSDYLYIFEAPIDALSFYQLNSKKLSGQNATLLSLSGAASKAGTFDNFLQERLGIFNNLKDKTKVLKSDANRRWPTKVPKEIHFCVDNDEAGRELVQKFDFSEFRGQNGKSKFLVNLPADLNIKDWNDQLKTGKTGRYILSMAQMRPSFYEHKSVEESVAMAKEAFLKAQRQCKSESVVPRPKKKVGLSASFNQQLHDFKPKIGSELSR